MKWNSVYFFLFPLLPFLFLFYICIFFLEGEKKSERDRNDDKEMHGVPFHPKALIKSEWLHSAYYVTNQKFQSITQNETDSRDIEHYFFSCQGVNKIWVKFKSFKQRWWEKISLLNLLFKTRKIELSFNFYVFCNFEQ